MLNHLYLWVPILIFVDSVVGFLLIRGHVILWMPRFSVSERKITPSLFVFLEDLNLWGSATHEYHLRKLSHCEF